MKPLDIEKITAPYKEKLLNIKVAAFDVDGVLTDSRIFWAGEEVGFNRFFNAQDGYGLKLLKMAGLKVGIITGGNSRGVKERFELLGLDFVHAGNEDKREAYKSVREQFNVDDSDILYMGDEFFDLPLLNKAGFSITVPHASPEIRKSVDYITQRDGGHGAVREIVDMIRHSRGFTPEIAMID
jgi:3-deoxy-D-manno-octulosonate 8-phosphate phosphatase (KDO 8-P phosphatase)